MGLTLAAVNERPVTAKQATLIYRVLMLVGGVVWVFDSKESRQRKSS